MTYDRLLTYLCACVAFENPVYVTGHPAPDTDAAVSALFEAWRLTRSGVPAIPVLQGSLSRETAWLLGDVTFPAVMPQKGAKWVLTDHHDTEKYDGTVVAVIDHHPVAAGENLTGTDACIRPVGAATTLVAQRIREDGIAVDAACARMLLGAVLLDTEGLSPYKAQAEDREIAAWLGALCGEPLAPFYEALKEQLLSETDPTVLYDRDYRVYTAPDGSPVMGFAILKVKQGNLPDLAVIRRRLAADVAAQGYAAAVAKISLYAPDDTREEVYLAAGPAADAVLAEVILRSGPSARRTADDEVFLPADCIHWGRKRYAARLMEILMKKD
ncbi:MAG: DHH family phosphoesterase [Clostridia bacterium]|nr:DHH family phosphoesterase [Clostridia bacterium]